MTFNLREHVREILAATAGEDLDELVHAVFSATPASMYAEAYRQALAPIVRVALASAERPDTDSRLDQAEADAQNVNVEPDSNPSGEGAKANPTTIDQPPLPAGPNLHNSRVAILRRNRYRMTVWVGDGQYRSILDCTVTDLEHAAAESDQLAESNAAAARRYRRLLKVMAEHHAEKVSDLTDKELEEVLGDE